mgnify:CR=1 FL=1
MVGDDASFHMDILPALPEDQGYKMFLEARRLSTDWSDTALAITDREDRNFENISNYWPRSNPKGFAKWFVSKMGTEYHRQKRVLYEKNKGSGLHASVEDVPDYKIRTPLQSAVMILKRHRDMMFEEAPDDKPISIIISTLAAHAYNGEDDTGDALGTILGNFTSYIEHQDGKCVITNPSDPLENFADKWEARPERQEAFFSWVSQCQTDFGNMFALNDFGEIAKLLETGLGEKVTDKVLSKGPRRPRLLKEAQVASTTTFSFPAAAREPKKPKGFA